MEESCTEDKLIPDISYEETVKRILALAQAAHLQIDETFLRGLSASDSSAEKKWLLSQLQDEDLARSPFAKELKSSGSRVPLNPLPMTSQAKPKESASLIQEATGNSNPRSNLNQLAMLFPPKATILVEDEPLPTLPRPPTAFALWKAANGAQVKELREKDPKSVLPFYTALPESEKTPWNERAAAKKAEYGLFCVPDLQRRSWPS